MLYALKIIADLGNLLGIEFPNYIFLLGNEGNEGVPAKNIDGECSARRALLRHFSGMGLEFLIVLSGGRENPLLQGRLKFLSLREFLIKLRNRRLRAETSVFAFALNTHPLATLGRIFDENIDSMLRLTLPPVLGRQRVVVYRCKKRPSYILKFGPIAWWRNLLVEKVHNRNFLAKWNVLAKLQFMGA